jgi:RNA polymerase sigma-70 factor (ECF subfamily)
MRNFETHPDTAPDDETLLTEFVDTGDAATLGRLYTRHMPLVYGLCLRYLGRQADAEDAVMEIFEVLVDKLPGQRVRNFRTWLCSVARNHCLQKLRREKRVVKVDFEDRIMESPPLVHLLSEGTDEAALTALEKCMARLPERQREAVTMFFMEHLSYADIADATLGDTGAVKSHIQNGKRNLRICLERHGVRL